MTREESIQFYKAHAKRLYNISLRIVRDSGEAEEIMQDNVNFDSFCTINAPAPKFSA